VQLAFAINLGLVTKIHRRTAIVAHVTRGGTGLMMEQFGPAADAPAVKLRAHATSKSTPRMPSASAAPVRTTLKRSTSIYRSTS